MNAYGYALAVAFLTGCDGWPLPTRAAWLACLHALEPHPADLRRAVIEAHESGHFRAGRLTPAGVPVALEALRGAAVPPLSIEDGPTVGQVVTHEP